MCLIQSKRNKKSVNNLVSNELANEYTLHLIRFGINKQFNTCEQCPMYFLGIKTT